jgi:hypothetical protein
LQSGGAIGSTVVDKSSGITTPTELTGNAANAADGLMRRKTRDRQRQIHQRLGQVPDQYRLPTT